MTALRAAPTLRETPWVCPWGICTHAQAQECRAETRATKRHRGCGSMFTHGTTPEQAKQMIAPFGESADRKAARKQAKGF